MSEEAAALHRVVVPRDNVSDERYLLLAWAAPAGGDIAAGDVLGEFETSKSVFELPAEHAGVFHPLAEEGTQVAVGQVVAVIADRQLTEDELAAMSPAAGTPPEPAADAAGDAAAAVDTPADGERRSPAADVSGVRFSKAAEALITEHRIDRSHFAGLGLVRGSDVELHLARVSTRSTATGPDHRPGTLPAQVRGSAIVIFGAGGHAKMILDLLAELRCFQVVGLLDPGVKNGQRFHGHRVLGPDSEDELARLRSQGVRLAVNAVGGLTNRPLRPAIYDRIRTAGFGLPTLVHPKAAVDASAQLGEGAQVLAGAYVGASSVVGDDCIINNGTVIAHDCTIADHAHIAPGAILAGGVTIGRNTLVGMGASIYLGVTVGTNVIIANGVDVFGDVPDVAVVRRTHR
jgi:sugar O-acyltransferase (sialic acid O-acetyltransferase NeuD family)